MNKPLFSLAEKLGLLLQEQHLQIATAESCTGGGIAYVLTAIPGSSQWFDRSVVTYSNAAKQELLMVTDTILQNYGAVSAETAKAMAEGLLKISSADITLSVTGIAGPTGGSAEKPVGTVWFGIARRNLSTQAVLQTFQGNRESIRLQAIEFGIKFTQSQLL